MIVSFNPLIEKYEREKDWAKIVSIWFLATTIIVFGSVFIFIGSTSRRIGLSHRDVQVRGMRPLQTELVGTDCTEIEKGHFDCTDSITKEKVKIKPLQYVHTEAKTVVVTAYNSVQEQTDADFCIAANGQDICKPNNKLWCAYNGVAFGTRIVVPGFGECEVVDRLNKRYGQTRVDLYWGKDTQGARAWGKQTKEIIIIY